MRLSYVTGFSLVIALYFYFVILPSDNNDLENIDICILQSNLSDPGKEVTALVTVDLLMLQV